jgi:hypothetical protein
VVSSESVGGYKKMRKNYILQNTNYKQITNYKLQTRKQKAVMVCIKVLLSCKAWLP